MKKIIVAGAGHGGLTAAFNLAKNGYEVTVFEKSKRDEIGYDWHDSIRYAAFDESGIERPDEAYIKPGMQSSYENPASTVKLIGPEEKSGFLIDRKLLVNYLIEKAEGVGVKFAFGCEIISAILDDMRVAGIRYKNEDGVSEAVGDMVIDACGMNSPIRKSLPACFGIRDNFKANETFYVYRAYYENLTGETVQPPYLISFFHMGKPGIDWLMTDGDSADILVGKFGTAGKLTKEEIDASVADYRSKYPFIGQKIIRGGTVNEIPLSKMLPLLVADGYALVGDSAGMTIPLNGSGVVLSMRAGKILADKIIEAEADAFSIENLWKYQYEYFQTLGKSLVMIDVLKNFFTCCSAKDVDYFLEKKILTADMFDFDKGLSISPSFILHILAVGLPLAGLLPALIDNLKSIPMIDSVAESMPSEYDKKAVEDWILRYSEL